MEYLLFPAGMAFGSFLSILLYERYVVRPLVSKLEHFTEHFTRKEP